MSIKTRVKTLNQLCVETRINTQLDVPKEARKSFWAARMKDISDKYGVEKLCIDFAQPLLKTASQLQMLNKINAIKQQKASLETAALFITQLEKLIEKNK
jgi:hypothetical protein